MTFSAAQVLYSKCVQRCITTHTHTPDVYVSVVECQSANLETVVPAGLPAWN